MRVKGRGEGGVGGRRSCCGGYDLLKGCLNTMKLCIYKRLISYSNRHIHSRRVKCDIPYLGMSIGLLLSDCDDVSAHIPTNHALKKGGISLPVPSGCEY